MSNVTHIQMHKELTQIQTVVLDGDSTATQVRQMDYQFFHLSPNLTVKGMKYRGESTFADVTKLHHIVKHLDTPNLFTLLWTYCAMKMAG